jgi:Xaa-Pro aminopeptidase
MDLKELFLKAEAVIVSDTSNLFYFSGISNADARVILAPKHKFYLTDKRNTLDAQEKLPSDFTVCDIKNLSLDQKAVEILRDLGAKTLGYEEDTMLKKHYAALSALKVKKIPVQAAINAVRARKSPAELEKIKKAQAVTEKVYAEILRTIRAGDTERAVKARINTLICESGCENAFDTIVAFGKNTAKPHSVASDTNLGKNECILLDYGAKYKGYCSDMTRCFCMGRAPDGYAEVYDAVLQAQQVALSRIKAGLTGRKCDGFARSALQKRGLDTYFTHSLGHSLGIDIHENPRLSPREKGIIGENTVTSIEPGVYLEGKYGVRIEDIVIFQKDRVDNLTKAEKSLIII